MSTECHPIKCKYTGGPRTAVDKTAYKCVCVYCMIVVKLSGSGSATIIDAMR